MVGTVLISNVEVLGTKHCINDKDPKRVFEWDEIHFMKDLDKTKCSINKDLVSLIKPRTFYHLVVQLTESANGYSTKTSFKCIGVIPSENKELINLDKVNNVSK